MDIIRYLKDQHEEVKHALSEIIGRNRASESPSLLETLSKVLRLHMQIEETILYPAARRCFEGDPTKPSVLQSSEEHEVARQCLSVLESTPPTDERFIARAKVLKGILREHILEEESDLFPSLATKLGQSGIEMLGDEAERQMSQVEAERKMSKAVDVLLRGQVEAERQTTQLEALGQVAQLEAESAPRPAKPAATKPPVTKPRGAKVAQTRRQRAAVRGAKGSRRQASASRSPKGH